MTSSMSVVPWAPWVTITVGGVPCDERVARIKRLGNQISPYARSVLPNVTTAPASREITLACGTLEQLGFTESPKTEQFLGDTECLRRHGLRKLPAEAGLCIREAYEDQRLGEYFRVGMDPIHDSDGNPCVFYVGRVVDKRWLCGCRGAKPERRWYLKGVWAFELISK